MKRSLVVFDWEGTLSDGLLGVARAFNEASEDVGLNAIAFEQLQPYLGLDVYRLFQQFNPSVQPHIQAHWVTQYQQYYMQYSKQAHLYPGIKAMLEQLDAANYLLGVATCKGRDSLNEALTVTGLTSLFIGTKTPNEAHAKPNPEPLLQLLALSGLGASEAIMVGDSPSDMQCAIAAGFLGVGVCFDGSMSASMLKASGASHVFHTVAELKYFLMH